MAQNIVIGVYAIDNIANNKRYVGSSKNIYARWRIHKTRLRGGYHENMHLQRAWDKYGEDQFRFSVLTEVETHNEALMLEQELLDDSNQYYNVSDSAYAARCAPHKESTKKKISIALKNSKKAARQRKQNHIKSRNNHPHAYLTKEDVVEIRRLWEQTDMSQRAIANKFGTNQQRVSKIVRRETWRYV